MCGYEWARSVEGSSPSICTEHNSYGMESRLALEVRHGVWFLLNPHNQFRFHSACVWSWGHKRTQGTPWASNGQVAVSAFGSGCACPTAVIAICPICQCSAEPQLEVCSAVHSSSLCPLAAFASWALQG